jgi:hypothetical protein
VWSEGRVLCIIILSPRPTALTSSERYLIRTNELINSSVYYVGVCTCDSMCMYMCAYMRRALSYAAFSKQYMTSEYHYNTDR